MPFCPPEYIYSNDYYSSNNNNTAMNKLTRQCVTLWLQNKAFPYNTISKIALMMGYTVNLCF